MIGQAGVQWSLPEHKAGMECIYISAPPPKKNKKRQIRFFSTLSSSHSPSQTQTQIKMDTQSTQEQRHNTKHTRATQCNMCAYSTSKHGSHNRANNTAQSDKAAAMGGHEKAKQPDTRGSRSRQTLAKISSKMTVFNSSATSGHSFPYFL